MSNGKPRFIVRPKQPAAPSRVSTPDHAEGEQYWVDSRTGVQYVSYEEFLDAVHADC